MNSGKDSSQQLNDVLLNTQNKELNQLAKSLEQSRDSILMLMTAKQMLLATHDTEAAIIVARMQELSFHAAVALLALSYSIDDLLSRGQLSSD